MLIKKYSQYTPLLLLLFVFPVFSDYVVNKRYTSSIYVDEKIVVLEDGLDLSQNDLQGIRIYRQEQELRNINFNECNLTGADFDDSRFVGCSFRSANLNGLRHDGYFKDCDFTDAIITGFMGEQIGKTIIPIDSSDIVKTKSFQLKSLNNVVIRSSFNGLDLSGFNLRGQKFLPFMVVT